jgi:hypothetical protein
MATDVTIEADDTIRGCHDHMQVVTNHQNGAVQLCAHVFDLAVEGRGSRLIKPLGGFVQNEEVWAFEEGTREQDALELPPG